MLAKTVEKYIRISPLKAREVINIVRGKNVEEALGILSNLNKKAAVVIKKSLESAIANAKGKVGEDVEGLYISKIIADQGPMYKRFKPAAMGRAVMIRKRTTHIRVELDKK